MKLTHIDPYNLGIEFCCTPSKSAIVFDTRQNPPIAKMAMATGHEEPGLVRDQSITHCPFCGEKVTIVQED